MITLFVIVFVWSFVGLAFMGAVCAGIHDREAVLANMDRNKPLTITVMLLLSPFGTALLATIAICAVLLERKPPTD
jgi:hypothetical protein